MDDGAHVGVVLTTTRVFVVTDTILPISIDPTPRDLVRVLVARTEIITPEMEQAIAQQVARLADSSPEVRERALKRFARVVGFPSPCSGESARRPSIKRLERK